MLQEPEDDKKYLHGRLCNHAISIQTHEDRLLAIESTRVDEARNYKAQNECMTEIDDRLAILERIVNNECKWLCKKEPSSVSECKDVHTVYCECGHSLEWKNRHEVKCLNCGLLWSAGIVVCEGEK